MKTSLTTAVAAFVFAAVYSPVPVAEAQYVSSGYVPPVAYQAYPYGYHAYGNPWYGYAHTAFESRAHGVAELMHAQAAYHVATAHAVATLEEARRRHLENHALWGRTYVELSELSAERWADEKAAQEARRAERKKQATAETATANQPKGLTPSQLDPKTGTLHWPELLRGEEYAAYRDRFETWVSQRANHENIAVEESPQVKETAAAMSAELRKHIREVRTMDYLEARKFIETLEHETVKQLGQRSARVG